MTAIAVLRRDEIIRHLAEGCDLKEIAPRYGITPAAISQVLSTDPEYIAARERGIEQKIEDCEGEIKTAPDALNLARARERFRVVSWRAEREFPHRWGTKTQAVVDVRVSVDRAAIGDIRDILGAVSGSRPTVYDVDNAQTVDSTSMSTVGETLEGEGARLEGGAE